MRNRPRTMPGVLELLPRDQVAFQGMVDTVRRIYELHGFTPIETPVLELADVLLTKTGGETERQVYFAQSTGSLEQGDAPDLAMRFDLTVPLARYVAEHQNELVFPFRRYQIQRVYRGESAQRGRFREFYQADIDIVGRETLPVAADAECPAVIVAVFDALDIGPFTVRVNHRALMQGFLSGIGVDDALHADVLREVDKLEKVGAESVRDSIGGLGVTPDGVGALMELVGTKSTGIADASRRLAALEANSPAMERGLAELSEVFETLAELGVSDDAVVLDASIARGLDYYTGTVFETVLDDHPGVGSICSGGRYDELAGLYTNTRLPGVGLSIGLTRLYWQLREAGMIGEAPSPTVAYVTIMDEDGAAHARGIAATLRGAGIPTQVADAAGRLGKQLKYVDRAGIRFALITGSDERARNVVTLKDMTGEDQIEIPIDRLADEIATRRTT